MRQTLGRQLGYVAGLSLLATLACAQSPQENVIAAWSSVQAPAAPKLNPIKLDPARTVVLSMDFIKANCAEKTRPRCVAALPNVARLLAKARQHKVLVIHTLSGVTTAADLADAVAAAPGEIVVPPRTDKLFGRMDKFFESDLEDTLRKRNIDTVVAAGTSANGAVLYTVSGAAARNFRVIVPVDAIPADTAYQEQFSVYQFMTGPVIRGHVELSTSDQIEF